MTEAQKQKTISNKLFNENKELKDKNNKLINDLIGIKSKVEKISWHLEETNLLNAKLLYKNQALSNGSLNERQKNNIVESISSAGSVEEVKALYEVLTSSVKMISETRNSISGMFDKHKINNVKYNKPNTLTEAVLNNGPLSVNRQRELVKPENNPVYGRFQELARTQKEKINRRMN